MDWSSSPTQQMFLAGGIFPSPVPGEDGERSEPGEGLPCALGFGPSPGSSLREEPTSPGTGEGEVALVAPVLCASNLSHKYCATLVSWYSSTRMNLKRP